MLNYTAFSRLIVGKVITPLPKATLRGQTAVEEHREILSAVQEP